MPTLEKFSVNLNLGMISLNGTWKPNEMEKKAAWEMYVELVTRISVETLDAGEGLISEALSSLHSLFATTRDILKRYGPEIAKPKTGGSISFGQIAVIVLNEALRPFLAKWHPLLVQYENTRKNSESILDHERNWSKNVEIRKDLEKLRKNLDEYATLLAEVAGVPAIHKKS